MVVREYFSALQRREQRRADSLAQRGALHINIGIWRKWAGLCAAVGIDVEKTSACRHAAARTFFVPGERNIYHLGAFLTKPCYHSLQIFAFIIIRCKFFAIVGDGNIFHKNNSLAAPFCQFVKELVGTDFPVIPRGHRYRRPEDEPALFELLHVGDELVIYARPSACIGHFPAALYAHDRHKVAAFVEQLEIPLVDICSVSKDREQDILLFACRLDNITAQHRLAACKQDKADTQFVCFVEYFQPFPACELAHGLFIGRCIVASGIAARTVKIAAAGYTCDQKRRNMLAVVLGYAAFL